MDIKYKSSSFATYSQYFASPIIIGIFLYYAYAFLNGSNLSQEEYFFLPFWIWASFIIVVNMVKLRYIKVKESFISIKSLIGDEVLDYKDIEWINQNIFGSNWYILSIKYKDIKTGKSRIIFVFPEMYSSRERVTIFGELNITKYIRDQAIKANPSYNIEAEPSRWYLTKWIFLTLIPFILISFMIIK